MDPCRRIAFVINAAKPGAEPLAHELAQRAREMGRETCITSEYPVPSEVLSGCDACCVIGGDGTMLSVVEQAAIAGVPLIGVNMGKLGFLAVFSPKDAHERFAAVLEGDYRITSRALLSCTRAGHERRLALNDVVFRTHSSRMVRLEVRADDKLVNVYSADGLIFSTPTGSTAYNLSAGGPLVHPHAPVIAMTPICPHTLSNRSVIFSDTTNISIILHEKRSDVRISLDGQPLLEELGDSVVQLGQAPERLKLILNPEYSHFEVVRTKLGWTGDNLGKHIAS